MKDIKLPPIGQEATEAWQRLGAACRELAEALGKWARAAMDAITASLSPGLLEAVKIQAALNEAPPRVRHLALHAKKARARKKNLHRAMREYEKRRARE